MTDINKIAADGFSLSDRPRGLKDVALFSLEIALKAFFSTYQNMKYVLSIFDDKKFDQNAIDFNHSFSYCEACAEVIVHFQHFVELVCKDFLRAEHELLASRASSYPVILHKLLKKDPKDPVNSTDLEKLKSIEFTEALERLYKLIHEGRIGHGQLEFIAQAKPWLERLNGLRNRLWHRGTFILRYPALDNLVGEYFLPFIKNVTVLPDYSGLQRFWKYQDLKCGVDPIELIQNEFTNARYNVGKIAFLKELGRAAYENPLLGKRMAEPLDRDYRHRAEHIAAAEINTRNVTDVHNCPVCGVKSLVVYEDVETEGDPLKPSELWRYTYQVKCMCCTFEINHHLKNASVYGLPIEDYWHAEEM